MRRLLLIVLSVVASIALLLVAGFVAKTSVTFARERKVTDRAWAGSTQRKLAAIGMVKHLTILPIVEADAAGAELRRGIGLSYLVEADGTRIVFDVAGNPAGEPQPPLVTNAGKLGVDLKTIKAIVISHSHRDHVGDLADVLHARDLGSALAKVPIYVPEPVDEYTKRATILEEPRVLAPGVATIGTIAKTYWGMGTVREQALAINVEGKGIVLIVGCGHQSLERLIVRTHQLFAEPLYGIVGGLHYPATKFGEAPAPVSWLIRVASTGEQPWHGPLRKRDVTHALALLDREPLGLIGLSPHDSCAWTLATFRRHFGARYHDVKAGAALECGARRRRFVTRGPQAALQTATPPSPL